MPGKCSFQDLWITNDSNLAKWLRPVPNEKYKGYCMLCRVKFDISHSGVGSVETHGKGKKHQELANALSSGRQTTLSDIFASANNVTPSTTGKPFSSYAPPIRATDLSSESNASRNISGYVIRDDVTKAEILWALNKVYTHSSDRGFGTSSDLFPLMFPDSAIAAKFRMHKDKLGYMLTYGLGPFFEEMLVKKLLHCDIYSISFDESLNKIAHKGQMDIAIRFWDVESNTVSNQYLTSVFLDKSTADDLMNGFCTIFNELGLPLTKILQIAVDGPNVNLKFLMDFKYMMNKNIPHSDEKREIIDIGTCSLHNVNNCYKRAHKETGWNIDEFLRALYFLLKDFPSRRSQFKELSGMDLFPLKMCTIRWTENSKVFERALKMLPGLRKYVEAAKAKATDSKNFCVVKTFVDDPSLPAKLTFLQSIMLELEPFLVQFQSNFPLVPFLYSEVYSMARSFAERFVKMEVMSNVKSAADLTKVDINKSGNLLAIKDIDVGFGARSVCQKMKDVDILYFRKDCRNFLLSLYKGLTQGKKSPLLNRMVKGASCLSPKIMLSNALRKPRITIALQELMQKGHICALEAELIRKNYMNICDNENIAKELKSFNWKKERLDTLFVNKLDGDEDAHFLNFAKKILILFHGNAEVERGFSVNKECIVENLQEKSLVSQRCVYSAISLAGGVTKVGITKGMIAAVRASSSKRQQALMKKKSEGSQESKVKELHQNIKNWEVKKRKVLEEANEEAQVYEEQIEQAKKLLRKC